MNELRDLDGTIVARGKVDIKDRNEPVGLLIVEPAVWTAAGIAPGGTIQIYGRDSLAVLRDLIDEILLADDERQG